MLRNKLRIIVFTLISIFTFAENVELKKAVDENGYEYTYTDGIYSDSREYTLNNGLKVYLTKKDNTPNIYSEIVVRAGSKNDPEKTTGLAHYFEHLMFKGSDEIGTIDWNKEKPILDQIEQLYEDHKKETDPEKKKEIYKKIDDLSYEASKYSISNEYSQLVSSIGGTGLNAFTSYDSTVFTMNFPSKNIEKAMFLERSRFDNVALREFHTELEAVYEEYNLTENNGFSLVFNKVMAEFFKDKPYSRPTIGVPYDLKNPSIKEIRAFFDKYYVANNIAIVLSGNLEYADTIKMIDKYWGNYRSNKEVNTLPTPQSTENYIESKETDIDVPNYSGLYVAVKLPHSEYTTAQIVSMLLYNGLDGIFDKLILDRKLQTVDQDVADFNDGTVHVLRLVGGANDSMSKTKKVYFEGIKTLKDGKFTEEQLSNIKSKIAKSYDSLKNNSSIITGALEDSFVKGLDLSDEDKQYNIAMNLTKNDIVEFANRVFKNQFIIDAYNSTDIDYEKLDKPEITALASNASLESKFAKSFYAMGSGEKKFDTSKLDKLEIIDLGQGIKLYYVQNKQNNQYDITYTYPKGYIDDNNLSMAGELFYEVGTKKYPLESLQNIMSQKGIMVAMTVLSNQTEFTLTGTDSDKNNILEGLKIFEDKVSNNIATSKQYSTFATNMIGKLEQLIVDPEFLSSTSTSYVIYGKNAWTSNIVNDAITLSTSKGNLYTNSINSVSTVKPEIFVYTSLSKEDVIDLIKQTHNFDNLADKARKDEEPLNIPKQKVYLTNADSKTVSVSFVGDFDVTSRENSTFALFYYEYENGLNGRTFKEIREKKGLTYSISNVLMGLEKYSYIAVNSSTQNEKMYEMIDGIREFLGNPDKLDKKLFDDTKQSLINEYEDQALKGYELYKDYSEKEYLGLETDRSKILSKIKAYTFEDYKKMYSEKVKLSNFSIVISGNTDKINVTGLEKYGEIIELTPEILTGADKK